MKKLLKNPFFILRFMLACWLVAKILGIKMWLADRYFPIAPVFDLFYEVPPIVHLLLYLISLSAIAYLLFQPQHRAVMGILLIIEIGSALLDQNRWQPWEYQYLFMLCLYIFVIEQVRLKNIFLLMLVGIYLLSGIQKLHDAFLSEVWVKMILQNLIHAEPAQITNWRSFGYFIPIAEISFGLMLLFKRTTNTGLILLMAMHLIILTFLVSSRYNIIVWPWNLFMIGLLLTYFNQHEREYTFSFSAAPIITLLVWFVLPLSNFVGIWDHYLSGSLYSGKITQAIICIKNREAMRDFPYQYYRKDIKNTCDGEGMLSLQHWAMRETAVPPYPEKRVYLKVFNALQKQYPDAELRLGIYYAPLENDKIEWIVN
jgi:hypothetical protein